MPYVYSFIASSACVAEGEEEEDEDEDLWPAVRREALPCSRIFWIWAVRFGFVGVGGGGFWGGGGEDGAVEGVEGCEVGC